MNRTGWTVPGREQNRLRRQIEDEFKPPLGDQTIDGLFRLGVPANQVWAMSPQQRQEALKDYLRAEEESLYDDGYDLWSVSVDDELESGQGSCYGPEDTYLLLFA